MTQKEPTNGPAWRVRALCEESLGRFQDAIASYTSAIEFMFDDAAELRHKRALCYIRVDRVHGAIEYYNELWRIQRKSNGAFLSLLYLISGEKLLAQQIIDEMIEKLSPASTLAEKLNIVDTCRLPGATKDQLEKSLSFVQEALMDQKSSDRGKLLEGLVLYRLGRYDEALGSLSKPISQLSRAGEIERFFLRAMTHQKLGETAQAKDWFEKANALIDDELASSGDFAPIIRQTNKALQKEATELVNGGA